VFYAEFLNNLQYFQVVTVIARAGDSGGNWVNCPGARADKGPGGLDVQQKKSNDEFNKIKTK
jgi:hypothetical protein